MKKLLTILTLAILAVIARAEITLGVQPIYSSSHTLNNDRFGIFTYRYNLTAENGDLYVPTTLMFHLEDQDGSPTSINAQSVNIVSIPNSLFLNTVNQYVFKLYEGTTTEFTVTAMYAPLSPVTGTMVIDSIPWSTNSVIGFNPQTGQMDANVALAPFQKPPAVAMVPEPTTLVLLAPIIGLTLVRRRR